MRLLVPVLLVVVASASCGELIGPDDDVEPPPASDGGPDASADGPSPDIGLDAGPTDATAQAEADAPAPSPPRRLVFLSKASATGNLNFQNGSLGVASADAQCMAEANAAGVTGQFVAWLSTAQTDAIDRLTEGAPWALRDGKIVFSSKDAVVVSTPQVEIDVDATGTPVVPNKSQVWTGTLAGGTRAPNRCADWTSATTATGRVGVIGATNATWTSNTDPTCNTPFHVLCFEK